MTSQHSSSGRVILQRHRADELACCAVGDIHGDLSKAVTCLELAGVLTQVNERPVWCGGNTIVVQLGDVLDRGDQEIGELAVSAH